MRVSHFVAFALVAVSCTRDVEPGAAPTALAVAPVASDAPMTGAARAAVATAPSAPASTPGAAPRTAADVPEHLARRFLAVAGEYRAYGRVDDEMRWAPFLCRMPMPASAHVSKSRHASTHGRKLYSLFAKDRDAYVSVTDGRPVAVGQVIVKESWLPTQVDSDDVPPRSHTEPVPGAPDPTPAGDPTTEPGIGLFGAGDHFHPYARGEDGKVFRAAERGPLFIMVKAAGDDAPDTDQGWIYGTVTPDGAQVTAAGRIPSCMKCHAEAPHDRLFGLGRSGP